MKKLIIIAISLLVNINLFSQDIFFSEKDIIYCNPYPGSTFNNPETDITIRFSKNVVANQIQNVEISILNESNQIIDGEIIYPANRTIIIFRPESNFNQGEKYKVEVLSQNNSIYTFDFTIDNNRPNQISQNELFEFPYNHEYFDGINSKSTERNTNFDLPIGFPAYEVINSNNPGDGYYFINRAVFAPGIPFYTIIMDTLGFPVCYKEADEGHQINNFVLQETGFMTYFDGTDTIFYDMDSSLIVRHSYQAKNGYMADGHEIKLLDDGSYWLLIYDQRIVDMSVIVPGGQVEAVVTGLVIQHIDDIGNVLFEWSSWDHFEITDADPVLVNLVALGIDYVHGNALDFDFDGNILISSRNLSEITKINISTGEVMWRWGGTQNQFEFVDDTLMFSAQHNISYLGDNIYSLFDNGNVRSIPFSRGLYYELDTDNMTATLVSNNNHFDSLVFAPFMGGYFTSPNNERVMGWSYNFKRYVLSEYDSLGNILLEVISADTGGFISYRVEKHIWETNAVSFDQSEYYIDEANVSEEVIMEFELTNNLTEEFVLNGFNSSDGAFELVEELPVLIEVAGTVNLNIRFIPTEEKSYTSAISLFTDNEQLRIGKQFRINTAVVTSLNEIYSKANNFNVFPNPASHSVTISTNNHSLINNISVYNLMGELLIFNDNIVNDNFLISVEGLKPAVYILKIETNAGVSSKRLVIK